MSEMKAGNGEDGYCNCNSQFQAIGRSIRGPLLIKSKHTWRIHAAPQRNVDKRARLLRAVSQGAAESRSALPPAASSPALPPCKDTGPLFQRNTEESFGEGERAGP
jgi:hypothetical protein